MKPDYVVVHLITGKYDYTTYSTLAVLHVPDEATTSDIDEYIKRKFRQNASWEFVPFRDLTFQSIKMLNDKKG